MKHPLHHKIVSGATFKLTGGFRGPSPSGELLFHIENGTATITLNRPSVFNATSLPMLTELRAALQAFQKKESGVRLIIFRGAGEHFNAGADIPVGDPAFFEIEYATYLELSRSTIPVVSLVDGWVIGSGMGLSRAGHIIVGTERTRFRWPETNIGFFPDVGGTHFMPIRMRRGIAKFYLLTGTPFTAAEAMYYGWADRMVNSNDFDRIENDLQAIEPDDGHVSLDAIKRALRRFSQRQKHPRSADLTNRGNTLERFFDFDSLQEIVQKLKREIREDGDESYFARQTFQELRKRSLIGLIVANHLANINPNHSLADTFQIELAFATYLISYPDYREGCFAALNRDSEGRRLEKGVKREPRFLRALRPVDIAFLKQMNVSGVDFDPGTLYED